MSGGLIDNVLLRGGRSQNANEDLFVPWKPECETHTCTRRLINLSLPTPALQRNDHWRSRIDFPPRSALGFLAKRGSFFIFQFVWSSRCQTAASVRELRQFEITRDIDVFFLFQSWLKTEIKTSFGYQMFYLHLTSFWPQKTELFNNLNVI